MKTSVVSVVVIAFSFFFSLVPSGLSKEARKPNVVFIFIDDQGYYDLSCYGATEVKTPQIDKMAEEGTRFTDYYSAAPICSPSRAGLLTGCYPRRVGNEVWVHRADSLTGIHPDELTMAELFQENGYATACIGKWHLGFREEFLPRAQGFDHYYGLLHNLDDVETVYFEAEGGVPLLRNDEVIKRPADPAELTRLYTDETIRFMEAHKDKPFFIYLPHTMLHKPLGVSEEFQGSSEWGEYGDAIQEMDHHVGRIFDSIERLGIANDTIVVYTTDNGRGPGRNPQQKIRGGKISTYEGGLRVPAIAWGPGVGLQSGVESKALVNAMDWYPTLASLAGIEVPKGRVIDGRDMSALLKGEMNTVALGGKNVSLNARVPLRRRWQPDREWAELVERNEYLSAFFYHGSQGALAAVRWQNWKMYLNPKITLYDLAKDPGEKKPVFDRYLSRKLRGMIVLFQEEMRLSARDGGLADPLVSAQDKARIAPSVLQSLHAKKDLPFARYGERSLKMDLYRPKGAWGTLPAVVCIHGGGWSKGTRVHYEKVAQGLANRGYVTATISYRLSGEAPFPAQIQDCKAAVRYLRANAKEYGIDPTQIAAIGSSASGHLAALLGTTGEVEELEGKGGNEGISSAIQAVIPMGAQTHLMSERTKEVSRNRDIWKQYLSGSQEENPKAYRLASPMEHLDQDDAVFWFITGENDDKSTRGEEMRGKMASLGLESGIKLIAGAPHGFLHKQGWFDEMIDEAAAFLNRRLK